jgi:hypothetical protein
MNFTDANPVVPFLKSSNRMDDSIYELKRPPGVRLNFGFVFFARLIWFLISLSIPDRRWRKDEDSPSRSCGKLK